MHTPNHAMQLTSSVRHAGCSPADLPRQPSRHPEAVADLVLVRRLFASFPGTTPLLQFLQIRALLPGATFQSPVFPMSFPSQRFGLSPCAPFFPSGAFVFPVLPVWTERRFSPPLSSMPLPDSSAWVARGFTGLLQGPKSPNQALQRTAPGRHGCCSPQSPPRSSRAVPPQSLSLRSLGIAWCVMFRRRLNQSVSRLRDVANRASPSLNVVGDLQTFRGRSFGGCLLSGSPARTGSFGRQLSPRGAPLHAMPNTAVERTGFACHAGCSPADPPRSQRATRNQSLTLGALGVSSRLA
jgi:hypothetical protein